MISGGRVGPQWLGRRFGFFFTKDYKEKIPKNLFFSGKSFILNSLILCESTGSADYRLSKHYFREKSGYNGGGGLKKYRKIFSQTLQPQKGIDINIKLCG